MHLLYFTAAALLLIVQVSTSQGYSLVVSPKNSTTISEGDMILFLCNTIGPDMAKPSLMLQWMFEDSGCLKEQVITTSRRRRVHDFFNISILKILDVSQADAGTYTCKCTDSMSGKVTLESRTLIVTERAA